MVASDETLRSLLNANEELQRRVFASGMQAEKIRLLGTEAQRSRLTEIENWHRRARRLVDDIFEQNKVEWVANEKRRLRARAATQPQQDVADGRTYEQAAEVNVLGRQRHRRVALETLRMGLVDELKRDVVRELSVRRQTYRIARETPEHEQTEPTRERRRSR